MFTKTRILAAAAVLAAATPLAAQLAEKKALTLEAARAALHGAQQEAVRLGAHPSIAVVDDGGHIVAVERMDDSFPAGARVSVGKAATAAVFRKPTAAFEEAINKGRYTMTALEDFTPLQGGVPLFSGGTVVGGIGVSGAASQQQDEAVAMAGARALEAFAAMPVSLTQSSKQASAAGAAPPAPGLSGKVLVNIDRNGVALQGFDPVAYFTDGRPVKGSEDFRSAHLGATYYFASQAHKDLFEKNPAMYAPSFGGYCGYAASINRLSPISPEFFQVLDGRLVLQHNKKAWDLWNAELAANIGKAEANWPGLVDRNGAAPGAEVLVNLDKRGVAIQGHDPVAYFREGRPVPGSPEFEAVYQGAKYQFASKEHREQFERNPAMYAPAFGGYCGYAASINKLSPVNPEIWQIEGGRLILQHTPRAYELFNKDLPASVNRADSNWPGLTRRFGRDGRESGSLWSRIFG